MMTTTVLKNLSAHEMDHLLTMADEDSSLCSGSSDNWTLSDEEESYTEDNSISSEDSAEGAGFCLEIAGESHPETKQKFDSTVKEHTLIDFLNSTTNESTRSTHSVMSVHAVSNLKKQIIPNIGRGSLQRSASTTMLLQRRVITITQNRSAQDEDATYCISEDPSNDIKPDGYLLSILGSEGISAKIHPGSSLEGYFFEWTDENISAYKSDLVAAIRTNNLAAVQTLHKMGRNLLCCNKFGESVVHMICRNGYSQLLKYFMVEASIPIRLRDDSGRTPLHDACWSNKPNFDCVKLILEAHPELVLISDNRGFTPLAYVPRSRWGDWCSFLDKSKKILQPLERFA